MEELRLAWEPQNKTPLSMIEEQMTRYLEGKQGGVTILANGTLIFTPNGRDDNLDAQMAMKEARFLVDFNIVKMKDGGYLVQFHHSLAVYVSEDEFKSMQNEIKKKISDLKFPEEIFMQEKFHNTRDLMIGLYARGKLQYDAHHFSFYKRLSWQAKM